MTGVPFVAKTIDVCGQKIDVVVPVFDSKADIMLPTELLQVSDDGQFRYCNKQLYLAIMQDSSLRAQFSQEDIERLMSGKRPIGFTWHHNEEVGKMQLVGCEVHKKTNHTGGRNFWGGGSEKRSLEEFI